MTLYHLLSPPPGGLHPGSQVTASFSDDQARHQTSRDHQEASCSSRYCYSAGWQAAEAGVAKRLLFPKAPLYLRETVSFTPLPPRIREERNERNQTGQLCLSPSLLPSYLGQGLRWLEEVPIPRVWAVNMEQVVGRHVEVMVSEGRREHSDLELGSGVRVCREQGLWDDHQGPAFLCLLPKLMQSLLP